MDIEEYLEKHHLEIKNISDRVLNVWKGTKIVNGVDTGEECIKILVDKKLAELELKIEEIIPKFHGGFKTDIVELKTDGWKAGKTPISRLSPKQQKRKLGLMQTKFVTGAKEATTNFEIDWRKSGKLIAVRNQGECGSCVAFAVTNTWADNLSILKNEKVILNPQHIFFCGGGSCQGGSSPETVLQYGVTVGCALDEDCPYVSEYGKDEPCGYGLKVDWYIRGKKLDKYTLSLDAMNMKENLKIAPLVTTMNVQQSFMNYVSGIYKPNNVVEDPIVGGHAIETVGCSDSGHYWICKNQWDISWGEEGYFQIGYGECGIDTGMFVLTLSNSGIMNNCVNNFQQVIADIQEKNAGKIAEDLVAGIKCLAGEKLVNVLDIISKVG